MALIRQINFNTGTTLERFGLTPTISGATFSQKEKGLALECGSTKVIQYSVPLIPTAAFSAVIWARIRPGHIFGTHRAAGIGSNSGGGLPSLLISEADGGGGNPLMYLGGTNYTYFIWTPDKNWHCFVFTIPGNAQTDITSAQLFIDGVSLGKTSTSSAGSQASRASTNIVGGGNNANSGCFISKIKVYDTVLTQEEVNKEQAEFTRAIDIAKPKRNLIYPKVTDLSPQVNNTPINKVLPTWTIAAGSPTINGQVIDLANEVSAVQQTVFWTIGKRYKVICTVTNYSGSGSISLPYDNISGFQSATANGVYTYYCTPQGAVIKIFSAAGHTATVTVNLIQEFSGLVASYNMKPQGTTLVDTSGNGNKGTLSGNVVFNKDGLMFTAGNVSQVAATALTSATTWSLLCKIKNYVPVNLDFLFGGLSTRTILLNHGGKISFRTDTPAYYDFTAASTLIANNDTTLAFISNGTTISLYVNGVFDSTITPNSTIFSIISFGNGYISGGASLGCSIILQDTRTYNRVLTVQEIKDYHNSFAKQITLLEDFSDAGADGAVSVPREWELVSGTYKVGEFSKVKGELSSGSWLNGSIISWDTFSSSGQSGFVASANSSKNPRVKVLCSYVVGKTYRISFNSIYTNCSGMILNGTNTGTYSGASNLNGSQLGAINQGFNSFVVTITAAGDGLMFLPTPSGNPTLTVTNFTIVEVDPLPTIKDGTKYIEAVTSSPVYVIPYNTAYGTFQFDLYQSSSSNVTTVEFVSDKPALFSATNNNYMLQINSGQRILLMKLNGAYIMYSATGYVLDNTWYSFKITRTTAGVFTVLVKGGYFTPTAGYDNWTLVSTTSGLGTNPITDTTYTTSNYLVVNLNSGDRITNIKLTQGVVV